MVDHPFRTAAAAENGVYEDTLLEAGVKRTILVLAVDEELGDFEFDTGDIPLAVSWAATGYVYFYDSTDSTTADDGLTTLVSGNGLRYAIEDAASISLNSVLDVATVPAGTEVVGDAYIVGVGTGAFAGQDENLAVLTRRGWVFASPEIGMTVLNAATGENTQFTATGWGAFAVEFADGSITPVALQFPAGIVVEDTLNTPPGSPTTGKFWIVGSVPTGDFTGHGADLAYWTGAAWAFMDPADGWAVFHKAYGFELFYISGAWLGGAGSEVQTFSTAGADTWTKPARGNMAFIQAWGAGGSGGKSVSQSNGAAGGGGGAYVEMLVPLSSLSATEAVSVGAGGAAATSAGNGNNGGNSTLGSILTAYGGDAGGGGSAVASAGMNGGAGGGLTSRGSAGTGGGPSGGAVGSSSVGGDSLLGGAGGGKANSTAGRAGGNAIDGGGGGGANGDGGSGNPAAGGSSFRGGGGGGSRGWAMAGGAGGVSQFGGDGGAGATAGGNGTAGAQPGGGGGGAELGNSGKGGDGLIRVTVF